MLGKGGKTPEYPSRSPISGELGGSGTPRRSSRIDGQLSSGCFSKRLGGYLQASVVQISLIHILPNPPSVHGAVGSLGLDSRAASKSVAPRRPKCDCSHPDHLHAAGAQA